MCRSSSCVVCGSGGDEVVVGGSGGGSNIVAECWVLSKIKGIEVEVVTSVESSQDTYIDGG